jgi:hypothetical protein
MEASGTVAKAQAIEFSALEGSLSMMSKGLSFITVLVPATYRNAVLNDVLDLYAAQSHCYCKIPS